MKSYKRTIAILAISSLIAAGTGFGQKETVEKSKEAFQQAQNQLKSAIKAKAKKHEKPFVYSFSMPFGSKCRDVLVIPSSEIRAEKIGEITEDMAVMSRILEKQVREHCEHNEAFFYGASWLGQDCQNIFLEGYGALFLMKVDFPLLPVKEPEAEEVEKKEVDPTWEQAKRELHSPGFTTGVVMPQPMPFGGETTQKYDKDKVESFKGDLIKTLKYAANIRALKSEDLVVVVITGEGRSKSGSVLQNIVVSSSGDNTVVSQSLPGQTAFSSAGVLTVRVKKSDVDAYSKGKLSFEQFSQKVGVLIY